MKPEQPPRYRDKLVKSTDLACVTPAPNLTVGSAIDKLRDCVTELEEQHNKVVAAFSSALKPGNGLTSTEEPKILALSPLEADLHTICERLKRLWENYHDTIGRSAL